MKSGNWWVETGILTSGNDPSKTLSSAADQFGDEYDPMLFMTGDGHRNPPFQWVDRGVWKGSFKDLVDDDKVCCHVETYSDAVNINCVPSSLVKVFLNGKVFGWEPDFYKILQVIMETALDMLVEASRTSKYSKNDIHFVTKEMYRVHHQGHLIGEGRLAMTFWDIARSYNVQQVSSSSLPGFTDFLKHYQKQAMKLRTLIHPQIAGRIQKRIDEFPDHLHLITCGDAHVKINPLYGYIKPATGTFGVADQSSA